MENNIPRIAYKKSENLRIEVMNFAELQKKLKQVDMDHDPFSVHKIEFYLILVVTKNSYTHFVDFKSYQLQSGSAIFIAKNQIHHFSEELLNTEGYCIIFSSLFTENLHTVSNKFKIHRLFNYHIEIPVIHQNEMGKDSLISIGQKLYYEFQFPNNFGKKEILRSLLQVLFLKAERAKNLRTINDVNPFWLETFSAFKNLLHQDYTKTRSSKDYASKLFISYKLLNDIIKKLSGKTAKAFIDNFVTMEIKRLLAASSLSIKEISYKTGFEEPSNLVKFFKKNTNITPLKFRQQ
ncbi:MAG: AraC family transcriptional regulator [Jejuia sp.]